ncbi:hypothetical protein Tco_0701035 [Tanacetum coccineum]
MRVDESCKIEIKVGLGCFVVDRCEIILNRIRQLQLSLFLLILCVVRRVGFTPSRVILFGDIPTVIPSTSVVAPGGLLLFAPVISSAPPMVEKTLCPKRGGAYIKGSLDIVDFFLSTTITPPHKRFRDSYSFQASIEEDNEIDPIETGIDIELGIGDGDGVKDHVEIDPRDVRDDTEEYEADTSAGDTVEVGIDPMSAPIVEEEIVEPAGEDSSDSSGTRMALLGHLRICRLTWMMMCVNFTITCLRARMAERIYSLRLKNLKVRAILDIERDRVNNLRLHMSLSQEEFRQIRRDCDDT